MQWWRRVLHTCSAGGEVALLEIQRLASLYERRITAPASQARHQYADFIRQCGCSGNLELGKQVHAALSATELAGDRFLSNLLVEMYGKCGSVEDSNSAFRSISDPNVFSWTMLIAAYAQNGYHPESMQVFREMNLAGVEADSVTFVSLLNMFSSRKQLPQGKALHDRVLQSGIQPDVFLGTAFVNMYGKCGSVEDAQEFFLCMHQKDVVAWNAMLSAYTRNNRELDSLKLFQEMVLEGVKPDKVVFITLLEACAKLGSLEKGKLVHERVTVAGLAAEDILGHALLSMYGKCEALDEARSVFSSMSLKTVISWNVLLTAYLQTGRVAEVLKLFSELLLDGTDPDEVTFINVVDACTGVVELHDCKLLHERVLESGIELTVALGNALVNLFRKAKSLEDARLVFEGMVSKDVVTWTAMLSTYAQLGFLLEAFATFRHMDLAGVEPDNVAFIAVLEACNGPEFLSEGRRIHARVAATRFEQDVAVNTSLVNMYGKCGTVPEAKHVFDRMMFRNEISWNAMVRGFGSSGFSGEAFKVFKAMQLEGVKPDSTTFLILLDASRDLHQARTLHAKLVEAGFESDNGVPHTLVIMYGRHGSPEDVKNVFESMRRFQRDPALWNAMITATSENGEPEQATRLVQLMDLEGVKLNKFTYISLLDSCTGLSEVLGLHARLRMEGFAAEQELGNALVNSYGQCGDLESAKAVFQAMPVTNVISWTSSIVAYASNGQAQEALELLHGMHLQGIRPNKVTVLSLIDACVGLIPADRNISRSISAIAELFEPSMVLQTALLNMHGKCGDVENARIIFDKLAVKDSIAWNAMVSAYVQNGQNSETIHLFRTMDLEGVKPQKVSFLGLIDAVGATGDLKLARRAHERLLESGLIPNTALETCLIGTYGRCGSVDEARAVFESMEAKDDPVSWSALIVAYAQNWCANEALKLLKYMDLQGLKVGKITYLRLIESCAVLGALSQGKRLHRRIQSEGFEMDDVLGNALVTMYGKCGSLQTARELFDCMPWSVVLSWTTMVTVYALGGHTKEARELLHLMDLEGVTPTGDTFTGVLCGYSHAGLVEDGLRFLKLMIEDHSIALSSIHYSCAVDLIGRSGRLEEAQVMIQESALDRDDDFINKNMGWKVLLGACRIHGDVERAKEAAWNASNSFHSAPYILLSNMYLETTN